jgi:hypothetical protein
MKIRLVSFGRIEVEGERYDVTIQVENLYIYQ